VRFRVVTLKKTLINLKSEKKLKNKLSKKFEEAKKKINPLKQDLLPFFNKKSFVENFVNNFLMLYLKNFLDIF